MERLKIALVQMQAIVGDVEANLKKISDFTLKAAQEKADFICFPELAVHGYRREGINQYSEKIPGRSSQYIQELARNLGITIAVGFLERSESDKPYITQIICNPRGKLDKYQKTHLGKSEEPYFSPGNDFPVFDTPRAKIAFEICWDLHFPEVTTILSLKGAELIFAPHASPTIIGDRKDIWLKYIRARAYDNSVFIACCNLIGENGAGSNFGGGILVIDPKGNVIGEDFNNQESMLMVELPNEAINNIRTHSRKSMRDSFYIHYRRPELYKDIIKPLD